MAWLLSLKVLFMSAGIVSMALALKVSVPLVTEFSLSYAPLIWACLRPPYVYIIINGIIISIVASTRFQQKEGDGYVEQPSPIKFSEAIGYKETAPIEFTEAPALHGQMNELIAPEVKTVEAISPQKDEEIVSELKVFGAMTENSFEANAVDEDKFMISTSQPWTSPESMKLSEKPPVSSRFGGIRKSAKPVPEGGKLLGVVSNSKAKRHDTLENTWKAITEGRAMPLSRHMKKCETWENHGRPINVEAVKKSETFKDRTTNQTSIGAVDSSSGLPMKMRKEPSLSHDDLNRRVEDFIRKFNEEMKLQREQSLKKYWEMVNRSDNRTEN